MNLFLIAGGHIVTQNDQREHFVGDLLIEKNKITKIATKIPPPPGAVVIDAKNHFVIPGLIQTHTHLCQTLFRGMADDLALLDWLKKRIWPLEAAHDEVSLRASARLGLLEMHLAGTTSILDMGTVRHTNAIFAAAEESGMRYWGGKCLMDEKKYSGPLYETTADALGETRALIERWHNKTELLQYALCPRFAISCTKELLLECVKLQKEFGVILHTHASENTEEITLVKKLTGKRNIEYFDSLKLLNSKTVIAHGIHLNASELKRMKRARAAVTHCPSSNLKLASGIANIEAYLKMKLRIGLGSDGAPCNNTMDPFMEMRLAALLQKPMHGPKALPANKVFDLATRGGADVLGMKDQLGSLEEGKLADVVMIGRASAHMATVANPYSALVYSARGSDVINVWIHGSHIVKNREHQKLSSGRVLASASEELQKLQARANIH